MDNASKNSDEMGGKLQMTFNRMRQAQITNDVRPTRRSRVRAPILLSGLR